MREEGVKAQPWRGGDRDQGGCDKERRKIGSEGPDRNRNPAGGGREVGLRPERGVVLNETPAEHRVVEEGALRPRQKGEGERGRWAEPKTASRGPLSREGYPLLKAGWAGKQACPLCEGRQEKQVPGVKGRSPAPLALGGREEGDNGGLQLGSFVMGRGA